MLKQRIITAIFLLFTIIPLILNEDTKWFHIFTVGFITVAIWEWSKLSNTSFRISLIGTLLTFGYISILYIYNIKNYVKIFYIPVTLFWTIGVFFLLKLGIDNWKKIPSMFIYFLGFLLLICAWDSFIAAREISVNYLISVLSIVWLSDIAAYFGGKAFGKRKLAPSISPGKSWEGVFFGMVAVIVGSFFWIWHDYKFNNDLSFYSMLYRHNPFLFVPILLFLTAIGVAGDLFESLMKRSVGVKDSGRLLPGHGGVLDRVDALIPVVTLSMVLYWNLLN